MNNYDVMVQQNLVESKEKEDRAVAEIRRMLSKNEEVRVCDLIRNTGLSRSFFYTNEVVSRELKNARRLQIGAELVRPQKQIIEKSLIKEVELLKKRLLQKDMQIAEMEKELSRLRKAQNISDLNMLRNL